jgi:hypothetical protein
MALTMIQMPISGFCTIFTSQPSMKMRLNGLRHGITIKSPFAVNANGALEICFSLA